MTTAARSSRQRPLIAGALCSVLLGLGAPLAVRADPLPPAPPTEGWQFEASVPGLLPWMSGDLGVTPAVAPVHVDLSPGDIVSHLKFVMMGRLDARNDRFVGFSDLIYADVKFSGHLGIRDPDFLTGNVRSKMLISTNLVGYRTVDTPDMSVDLLAGVRLENIDDTLHLQGPRRVFDGGKSQFWADPLLGARFKARLARKVDATVWGDFGGFGAGSKFTGEVEGTVGYSLDSRWKAFGGWRYLYTDYAHNGFVFNTSMTGPVLGASYSF